MKKIMCNVLLSVCFLLILSACANDGTKYVTIESEDSLSFEYVLPAVFINQKQEIQYIQAEVLNNDLYKFTSAEIQFETKDGYKTFDASEIIDGNLYFSLFNLNYYEDTIFSVQQSFRFIFHSSENIDSKIFDIDDFFITNVLYESINTSIVKINYRPYSNELNWFNEDSGENTLQSSLYLNSNELNENQFKISDFSLIDLKSDSSYYISIANYKNDNEDLLSILLKDLLGEENEQESFVGKFSTNKDGFLYIKIPDGLKFQSQLYIFVEDEDGNLLKIPGFYKATVVEQIEFNMVINPFEFKK